MRFNAQELLNAWRYRQEWPAIHEDLYAFIQENGTSETYCDLCCSTGLLGQRIRMSGLGDVVGVEMDADAIRRKEAAGILFHVLQAFIREDNLDVIASFLAEHQVRTVVARRCIPEILDHGSWGPALVEAFKEAGVREWFLQGRVPTSQATHPLFSVEKEIAALGPGLRVQRQVGPCAWLKVL